MSKTLNALTTLWRHRYTIVLPLVCFPAVALVHSLSSPPLYRANATLHIVKDEIQSPLLQNISNPDHVDLLRRTLRQPSVVRDALKSVGLLLDGATAREENDRISEVTRNLRLATIGDDLIQISYASQDSRNITALLENIGYNFMDEVLAPERFRSEEEHSRLSNQVRYIKTRLTLAQNRLEDAKKKVVADPENLDLVKSLTAAEFDVQTLQAQHDIAKKNFDAVLGETQTRNIKPALRFIDPPALIDPNPAMAQHLAHVFNALVLALFISIFLIILRTRLDTSLRSDEEIRKELGLKIIGRMPNLGDMKIDQGRVGTLPRMNF